MANRLIVRKVQDNLWQWRQVNGQNAWASEEFYTGDINLLKESIAGQTVWLMVPGLDVVTQELPADIKDRRQLIKTLPFELEDDIISPIEDLHFAFGPIENETIHTAYGDANALQSAIDELVETGADVQCCACDYLSLTRETAGWSVLLENQTVYIHTGTGTGFATEIDTAPLYFKALSQNEPPKHIQMWAANDDDLRALEPLLPENISKNEEIQIESGHGCFWDLIQPQDRPQLDFRTGRLARKVPFDQWWHLWKTPAIVLGAAIIGIIGISWLAEARLSSQQKQAVKQTDEIYRQVVPKGNITNPERQLRALLGNKGGGSVEPSNAVELLTAVAPAIKSIGDVVIRNFRYNAENAQLQINIEAKSFGSVEQLEKKIKDAGYKVEIKSSNMRGDTHQAQLRVTEA